VTNIREAQYLVDGPRVKGIESSTHRERERDTLIMAKVSHPYTSRVTPGNGKSWNLGRPFSRPGKSWKVMEFRKTIFQAWKVMENSKGHVKSWKSHGK